MTLYYLTYRRLPFQEESVPALFKAITTKEPLYPKMTSYSQKVVNLIQTLLDKQAKTRPTIQDVISKYFLGMLYPPGGKTRTIDQANYERINRIFESLKKAKDDKKKQEKSFCAGSGLTPEKLAVETPGKSLPSQTH